MSKIYIEDEYLLGLIPTYLENRREDVRILGECTAARNYEEICNIGHKMKGSGGGYGLDRVSEIGHLLEMAGRARDDAAIERATGLLRDWLDHVEIVSGS